MHKSEGPLTFAFVSAMSLTGCNVAREIKELQTCIGKRRHLVSFRANQINYEKNRLTDFSCDNFIHDLLNCKQNFPLCKAEK